jgi:CheY-like chemotaxis protein
MLGEPAALVLLVDDDAGLRDALAALLAAVGYGVISACDGEEALAISRSGVAPTVILLDLAMPRKDGQQFRAEQVRDTTLAAIPVIILSADRDARQKAAALGVGACLAKPADGDELLYAVERIRPAARAQ